MGGVPADVTTRSSTSGQEHAGPVPGTAPAECTGLATRPVPGWQACLVQGAGGTIVVAEDDSHIADLVSLYLRREGFRTTIVSDGAAVSAAVRDHGAIMVIVDVGLPGELDGFEVCRRIRADGPLPVVMLTARDEEADRVLGLELGADDYVTKPFSPRELVARVRAVLRRSGGPAADAGEIMSVGPVSVDTRRREAQRGSEIVELTPREFDLLVYFLRHLGAALSRRQLLDGAWGQDWVGDERTVDVHVRQLRRKLGNDLPLQTVRNIGYRLG